MSSHYLNPQTDTLPPAERALRAELAELLEQARLCMAAKPDLVRVDALEVADRTASVLDKAAALVGQAVQMNETLRTFDELSVSSALASSGLSVALAALADAMEILQARLGCR